MPEASYYAWFLNDCRPLSRPGTGQKQPLILRDTKVSVKEEYIKDGRKWCQIWAPPGYVPEEGHPDLWVPRDVLSIVDSTPIVPVPAPSVVPPEVVDAFVTIAAWLKS